MCDIPCSFMSVDTGASAAKACLEMQASALRLLMDFYTHVKQSAFAKAWKVLHGDARQVCKLYRQQGQMVMEMSFKPKKLTLPPELCRT